MGRVKLAIKKIETPVGKQVTYSKRKAGLEKKAKELATLCDIDLLLILFSPAGKLSWINGSKSPPEEVLMRFANLSPQERGKRKVEALEQLKRTFKKLDHDVNVEEFTRQGMTAQNVEDLHMYLQNIQIESLHLQQKLRGYELFETVEEANKLEDFLQSRIQDVQVHKQLLESGQCIVPYTPSVGPQVYSEAVGNPGVLDNTAQGSWETTDRRHRAQDIVALQQNFFDQREADNTTTCLPSNAISLKKQMEGASNLFSSLKQMGFKDGTVSEKLRLELEANCSNAIEYGEDNPASLDNSLLAQNNLSLPWSTNSNAMSSQTTIEALQHAKRHYLQQHCFGSGDVKAPDIQQEEHFRAQSMAEIAHNVEWQR